MVFQTANQSQHDLGRINLKLQLTNQLCPLEKCQLPLADLSR